MPQAIARSTAIWHSMPRRRGDFGDALHHRLGAAGVEDRGETVQIGRIEITLQCLRDKSAKAEGAVVGGDDRRNAMTRKFIDSLIGSDIALLPLCGLAVGSASARIVSGIRSRVSARRTRRRCAPPAPPPGRSSAESPRRRRPGSPSLRRRQFKSIPERARADAHDPADFSRLSQSVPTPTMRWMISNSTPRCGIAPPGQRERPPQASPAARQVRHPFDAFNGPRDRTRHPIRVAVRNRDHRRGIRSCTNWPGSVWGNSSSRSTRRKCSRQSGMFAATVATN